MGALAKRVFPRAWGLHLPSTASAGNEALNRGGTSTTVTSATDTPRGVFHVAIAQCYDKKLEASRKDFRHENNFFPAAETAGDTPVQEVDLVLTTTEVMELIEERAAAHARAVRSNGSLVSTAGGVTSSAGSMVTTSNGPNYSNPPGEIPPTGGGVIPMDEEEPISAGNDPPQKSEPGIDPPRNIPPRNTSTSETAGSDDVAGVFFRHHSVADIAHPLGPGFPVGQAALSEDGLSLLGGVDGEGGAGGNSGGYLEYVFRHAAHRLFGREDLTGQRLVYREGRNPDFRETSLEVNAFMTYCPCAIYALVDAGGRGDGVDCSVLIRIFSSSIVCRRSKISFAFALWSFFGTCCSAIDRALRVYQPASSVY